MRMVIYVLAIPMSALFMGCGSDDGMSVGDVGVFCHTKHIGYSDVDVGGHYQEYADEWKRGSCVGGYIGEECIRHDINYTIHIEVCEEMELTRIK